MTAIVNKNMVKEALRELIDEESVTLKNTLISIFINNPNHTSDKELEFLNSFLKNLNEIQNREEHTPNSDDEFEKLIDKNFERFGETFRALA
ncbi:hypothetical protein VB796_07520 [Arcicella sp. LKC2W]|uniref:hypothetical protein n=1 Tax=Arcicella sp. LKC2W TaxID=2984198 RepID=UPI002B201214|nr:hypothetical protein [Arcicella sp. LKC2W]MEA5458880.1 hypothetical protein [Arcicella sp. LKC2W]